MPTNHQWEFIVFGMPFGPDPADNRTRLPNLEGTFK